MRKNRDIELSNDIWFNNQVEAIRQMEAPNVPDVSADVMQRISGLPQPMALPETKKHKGFKIASSVAAACIAGVVVLAYSISHTDAKASTTSPSELSQRLFDVYEYCDNYGEDYETEDAAYYDNPMADLF